MQPVEEVKKGHRCSVICVCETNDILSRAASYASRPWPTKLMSPSLTLVQALFLLRVEERFTSLMDCWCCSMQFLEVERTMESFIVLLTDSVWRIYEARSRKAPWSGRGFKNSSLLLLVSRFIGWGEDWGVYWLLQELFFLGGGFRSKCITGKGEAKLRRPWTIRSSLRSEREGKEKTNLEHNYFSRVYIGDVFVVSLQWWSAGECPGSRGRCSVAVLSRVTSQTLNSRLPGNRLKGRLTFIIRKKKKKRVLDLFKLPRWCFIFPGQSS